MTVAVLPELFVIVTVFVVRLRVPPFAVTVTTPFDSDAFPLVSVIEISPSKTVTANTFTTSRGINKQSVAAKSNIFFKRTSPFSSFSGLFSLQFLSQL